MNYTALLEPVTQFLHCRTPKAWIDQVCKVENLPLLLIDYLTCELKAAQTATWLIRKYVADKPSQQQITQWLLPYEDFINREKQASDFIQAQKQFSKANLTTLNMPWADELLEKMIRLIKEELHHFCQVWDIMQQRQIHYHKITASRYAKSLLREVTTHEPNALVDKLICSAYIEARSCERFAVLAPHLDDDLQKFYESLLRSEARHYQDYLDLAAKITTVDISDRIQKIGQTEAQLILSADGELRFHSGVPWSESKAKRDVSLSS